MSTIRLDHLLVGTPDLAAGVDWLQEATGARSALGGTFVGEDAGIAFASLGGRAYLGLLGPDGPAPAPGSLGARLGGLSAARLVGWACACPSDGLESVATAARSVGLPATVAESARRRPDGRVVKSRHLYLGDGPGGHLPFFVDWGTTLHPSIEAPAGLRLQRFWLIDPDPEGLARVLRTLGVDVEVVGGEQSGAAAVLSTSAGELAIAT